jgi:hypothetical protein
MGKDVISLKAAWDSLLKSIAENTVIRAVGVELLNFLKATVEEATKLAGILDGIMHLDVGAVVRAWRGLPPLERPQTVAETSPSPTGTVKVNTEGGGLGAVGMFQLRQAAAKDVGLTPEDRYDYFKNVQGGLQYFRQQLEAFNGDLDSATRAFKEGAGGARAGKGFDYLKEVLGKDAATVDPKVMTDIREAFCGGVRQLRQQGRLPAHHPAHRTSSFARERRAAFRAGDGKACRDDRATTAVGTNQQQIRSEDLRKAQEEQRRIESEAYATEEQRYKNFLSDLENANKAAAAKVAKAFEGITVDPEVLRGGEPASHRAGTAEGLAGLSDRQAPAGSRDAGQARRHRAASVAGRQDQRRCAPAVEQCRVRAQAQGAGTGEHARQVPDRRRSDLPASSRLAQFFAAASAGQHPDRCGQGYRGERDRSAGSRVEGSPGEAQLAGSQPCRDRGSGNSGGGEVRAAGHQGGGRRQQDAGTREAVGVGRADRGGAASAGGKRVDAGAGATP